MKNIPKKIFLQVHGDTIDDNIDFNELIGVTWCKDRINDDDLEYVYKPKKRVKKHDDEKCKIFTLPNGDHGILCFGGIEFSCPHCGKKYTDKNDLYLTRINRNKQSYTTVKCECGKRFKLSYDIMGSWVTPHLRYRIWIVAYSGLLRQEGRQEGEADETDC